MTIIGAYASQPTDPEAYYDLLAAQDWVGGLEIPYPNHLKDPRAFGKLIGSRFNGSIVTPIPGTMQTLAKDPVFGLASPDEGGRERAVEFIRAAYESIRQLPDGAVTRLALHSAPSKKAELEPFIRSIKEIQSFNDLGLELIIEHCDSLADLTVSEKAFLPLEDEIKAAQATGIRVSVNWGRSVLDTQDVATPVEQIRSLRAAGVLGGVLFSGISPVETQYGPAWGDAHAPLDIDEPTSLMTAELVKEAVDAAEGAEYFGVKVQVPKDADLETRLAFLRHVYDAGIRQRG